MGRRAVLQTREIGIVALRRRSRRRRFALRLPSQLGLGHGQAPVRTHVVNELHAPRTPRSESRTRVARRQPARVNRRTKYVFPFDAITHAMANKSGRPPLLLAIFNPLPKLT
eukprot:6164445-Pyramimonas_sp.AAC.1